MHAKPYLHIHKGRVLSLCGTVVLSALTNKRLFMYKLLLIIVISSISYCAKTQDIASEQIHTKLELEVLALHIDNRLSNLQVIAKSLANDTHIHQWKNQQGSAQNEQILLNKLQFFVDEFSLTSASFADKKNHRYWNHEGFLRVLDPQIDTWYFKYIASGESTMASIYHDKNKNRVDLYINVQQQSGDGLSGVATSFDSVLQSLEDSPLKQNGDLYLVDNNGAVMMSSAKNSPSTIDIVSTEISKASLKSVDWLLVYQP